MRRFFPISLLVLAVALNACGAADDSLGPRDANPQSPPPVAGTRLVLSLNPNAVYVGMKNRLTIDAFDGRGDRKDTDAAIVTSSDPSVVAIVETPVFTLSDWGVNGRVTRQRWPDLQLLSPGTTTLRVTLGDVSDSIALHVAAVFPSTALAVDSFTVIEYRVKCAWACPYLAYAPLLKLREPTGKDSVEVIGVEVTVPTKAVTCAGSLWYAPSESAHVNRIDPYLWANDLIFVSLDGTPLPNGPAYARVLVRETSGKVGYIEATGSIERMVPDPLFPRIESSSQNWIC